jgi:ribonucrease Y
VMEILIGLILGLLAGTGVGFLVRKIMAEREVTSAEMRAKSLLQEAKREAAAAKREALVEAKDEVAGCGARPKPS